MKLKDLKSNSIIDFKIESFVIEINFMYHGHKYVYSYLKAQCGYMS